MIGHDVLTLVAARSLHLAGRPVTITPYSYDDDDASPYNPGAEIEMREGTRPTVRSPAGKSGEPATGYYDESDYEGEYARYDPPVDGRADLIQILALYSAEPDWGMDADFDLSPLQAFTGGSQGFRHLRYGLFFMRIGRVVERIRHFTRMAEYAFGKGDIYWGVRFSARALHYLEDALSPFHLKPFPEWLLPLLAAAPKRFYTRTVNYHLNFERAVGFRLWRGDRALVDVIAAARPVTMSDAGRDALRAMRRSRRLFYPLYGECRKMWGGTMDRRYVKISPEEIDDLSKNRELEHLIRGWLEHASGWVKGYILRYTRLAGVRR
jgi:hypothetical protein